MRNIFVMSKVMMGQAAIAAVALALLVPGANRALAEDDLYLISVDEAMGTAPYAEKLDGTVKFFFGNSPHPEVVQQFGNTSTNKKTNGFAKSAGVACNHVLLSALIAFQEQAKSLGANAVINIKSNFKNNEVSLDSQVECYKGFIMAGVALKGEVAKVAE